MHILADPSDVARAKSTARGGGGGWLSDKIDKNVTTYIENMVIIVSGCLHAKCRISE